MVLDGLIHDPRWDTSVRDWEVRIKGKRSLIPDLPLFDDVAARALRIFKRLRVPDMIGSPTYGEVCDQWVFDLVAAIFGSFDPETKRRMIREFFVLVPKKNGKSSVAAAIIVTAAIMNERPEAELLLIAPTKTIADVAFKQARGIIRLDPELDKLFYAQDHIKKITHRISRAEIAIKAADTDAITGGKAAFTLIDETHEFAKKSSAAGVFVELRGALAARPDGFLLQITTQSKEPPSGVFKAELDKARAVRNGEIRLPVLAVLYELPEAMAINGGWKKPATWGLVNPNLGRSVDPQFLADQLLTAERDGPQAMALLASQHFNVQVGLGLHADRWIGADFWIGATEPGLTLDAILETSDVCTIGVDGGGMDDLFALAVIGRHAKTRRWQAWARAWADPIVMERRKSIAPKLLEFEQAGDLRFGESAEHEAEAAAICERVFRAGLLPAENGIGLDVFGIAGLRDALEMAGIPEEMIVGVGQGYKLQQAVLTLPRKLKDRSLVHCGQPLMAWCVGNAKAQLRGSNTVITKEAAGVAKIDPLIALFNGAMLMFANPVSARGMTPWDADPDYRMSA